MIVRDGISNGIDMLSNDNKMLLGVCWLVNIDSLAWCKVSYHSVLHSVLYSVLHGVLHIGLHNLFNGFYIFH